MWLIDAEHDLGTLTPAEQLWTIALACEEMEPPRVCVLALRKLAEHLDKFAW